MGKDTELAILFADVVGSTRLYDTMGDLRARDMIDICIEVMRSATEQRQGTVIKTMGDEVMATFPTADAALNAAAQMQQQISTHAQLNVDGQPVAIRIGCHFGPVMLENRDVFGAAVHTANRMTSQAKAGQIVTTAATIEKLSPEWRTSVRQIDIATIKGQGNEVALYEVLWQTEDVTSMVPGIATDARTSRPMRLRLRCQDQELLVDERHSSVTIGRAEDNSVVVRGNLISRLHARIEISRNKLRAHRSEHQRHVRADRRQEESFVRRDSLQIKGQGMIGLGRLPEPARLRPSASSAKRFETGRSGRGFAHRRRRPSSRRYTGRARSSSESSAAGSRRPKRRDSSRMSASSCARPRAVGREQLPRAHRARVETREFRSAGLGIQPIGDVVRPVPAARSARASRRARAGSRRIPATGTYPRRSARNQLTWNRCAAVLELRTDVEPVCPVIAEVVAAERLHRHRVAPHDAGLTGRGGGGLGGHRGAHEHAVRPVAGLVHQRRELAPPAAEHQRRDRHAARVFGARRVAGIRVGCDRET